MAERLLFGNLCKDISYRRVFAFTNWMCGCLRPVFVLLKGSLSIHT